MAAIVVSSNSQIAPNTIYGAHKPSTANDNIVNGSITGADILANSIGSNWITDNSLRGQDVADGSIASADLTDNSVASADIQDATIRGADVANRSLNGARIAKDTLTGTEINESTLGKVPDSSALDGNTSGAFYHSQNSNIQRTSDCATSAQTWTECAAVSVTVPDGHLWYVTVISSVTGNPGNANVEPLFCAAYTGPTCLSGIADRMTFAPNQYDNWSSSYTGAFSAGTYRFNTAMKWPFVLPANSEAYTETSVIVSDYRQRSLTGP